MAVTAGMVKELREKTGAGMMDCKNALSETGGDLERAIDYLRQKGLSDAAKRTGRTASEGVIGSYIHPGGKIGVQAILLAHDRMLATLDQYTWISKYIFPGGALPSLRAIEEIVRDQTGLRVEAVDAFGADYARTLRAWRVRFDAHALEVDALGFDATFRRMWDFYLAYCEAGFATGYLDVAQIVMSRPV